MFVNFKAPSSVRRKVIAGRTNLEEGWKNLPDTQIEYKCVECSRFSASRLDECKWAFDYSYDQSLPSYAFTHNINKLTITCNGDG